MEKKILSTWKNATEKTAFLLFSMRVFADWQLNLFVEPIWKTKIKSKKHAACLLFRKQKMNRLNKTKQKNKKIENII